MSGARRTPRNAGLARLAALLAIMIPLLAAADITATTRWADPTRVSLGVEFPGEGYHANWNLYRCTCTTDFHRAIIDHPKRLIRHNLYVELGSFDLPTS